MTSIEFGNLDMKAYFVDDNHVWQKTGVRQAVRCYPGEDGWVSNPAISAQFDIREPVYEIH